MGAGVPGGRTGYGLGLLWPLDLDRVVTPGAVGAFGAVVLPRSPGDFPDI